MTTRKRTTTKRPWLVLRHGRGSDYGTSAYTLWRHGKGGAVIIQAGLKPAEARLIEAAPELRDAVTTMVWNMPAPHSRARMAEWQAVVAILKRIKGRARA